jgi:hypothetical protein
MLFNYISIVFLLLSGITITVAAGLFSISGFTLLIPDESLFLGIIILAISFEIAKIASSTFLFHQMKNKAYPLFFKVFLTISIIILMIISAISTYSHLNYSISENMSNINVYTERLNVLNNDKISINNRIQQIDESVQSVNSEKSIRNKLKLKSAYDAEKNSLIEKLNDIDLEIKKINENIKNEDKFVFLNSLSKLLSIDKEDIFTLIILTIVFIVDPLAITLIIAGTFLLSETLRKNKENIKVDHLHKTTIKTDVTTGTQIIEEEITDNSTECVNVATKQPVNTSIRVFDNILSVKKEDNSIEINKINSSKINDNISFKSTLKDTNDNVVSDRIDPIDINAILNRSNQ